MTRIQRGLIPWVVDSAVPGSAESLGQMKARGKGCVSLHFYDVLACNTARRRTVGQKPVEAAKTLGMFRPPESLDSARIERLTPSMDSSFLEQAIGEVVRSIRALFKYSGGRNMPRVSAAFTGFWPTERRTAVLVDVHWPLGQSPGAGEFPQMNCSKHAPLKTLFRHGALRAL